MTQNTFLYTVNYFKILAPPPIKLQIGSRAFALSYIPNYFKKFYLETGSKTLSCPNWTQTCISLASASQSA